MKRLICVLALLSLAVLVRAQNHISAGVAVYPSSAWGGSVTGDFKALGVSQKTYIGFGAMAFGCSHKRHDEPNQGSRIFESYLAPQVSLHHGISEKWDVYLRGGAGWYHEKVRDMGNDDKLWMNGSLGTSLALTRHLGLYLEAGLPISGLGIRISL